MVAFVRNGLEGRAVHNERLAAITRHLSTPFMSKKPLSLLYLFSARATFAPEFCHDADVAQSCR